MNKRIKWWIAPVAAASANVALAADNGFYAGLGAGESHYKGWASSSDIRALKNAYGAFLGVDDFDGFSNATSDNSELGFKVFGGYVISNWLAVEASYLDAGEVDAYSVSTGTFYDPADNALSGELSASASAHTTALTLDVLVTVPLGPAQVFGKAGVYGAETELELVGDGSFINDDYRYSDSADATGAHYGVGIQIARQDGIGFRAEWERLDGVEVNDAESDVDLLSASLIYHF